MAETPPKKKNRFWLYFLSFIVMGALVTVEADVDSINCLVGLSCSPDPLVDSGSISLLPAGALQIGGVKSITCGGTDKVSAITIAGDPVCSADSGGSGTVTSISQGTGMSFSVNPLITTGTISLAQAKDNITIGGVRVANCSVFTQVSGWDASGSPICMVSGIRQITLGVGIGSNESPITFNATLFLNESTTSLIGGVKVANCTGTDKVSGWAVTNVPVCSADSSSGDGVGNSWSFVDRVQFIKTFVNVGTTFVDVYSSAFDPADTLINTSNMTSFRILFTVDYIGAGTQSVSFNQTTTNSNKLWVANFTSDCDPCDTNWQTIPSWASSIETFVEVQMKSTTGSDDPSFKAYQVWLR